MAETILIKNGRVIDPASDRDEVVDVLIADGSDLGYALLSTAYGVSADGRTIVGTGTNPSSGQTEAWIATLNTVPEPSSLIVWSLLGCVGAAIGRRRRKRSSSQASG